MSAVVPKAEIEHVLSLQYRNQPQAERVAKTLRKLTTALGLRTDAVHPTARHLRHSFAVSTLIGWQRSGVHIDEQIAVLSTFLGHYAGDPRSQNLTRCAIDRRSPHIMLDPCG